MTRRPTRKERFRRVQSALHMCVTAKRLRKRAEYDWWREVFRERINEAIYG